MTVEITRDYAIVCPKCGWHTDDLSDYLSDLRGRESMDTECDRCETPLHLSFDFSVYVTTSLASPEGGSTANIEVSET